MTVSKEFLNRNFLFNLTYSGNKAEAKTKWLKRTFNIELVGAKSPEGYQLKNANLVDYANHTDDYYLSVNNTTSLTDHLAVQNKQYVSVAKGQAPKEYRLLITSIRMEKIMNNKDRALTVSFEGTGEPIRLTLSPVPWD